MRWCRSLQSEQDLPAGIIAGRVPLKRPDTILLQGNSVPQGLEVPVAALVEQELAVEDEPVCRHSAARSRVGEPDLVGIRRSVGNEQRDVRPGRRARVGGRVRAAHQLLVRGGHDYLSVSIVSCARYYYQGYLTLDRGGLDVL